MSPVELRRRLEFYRDLGIKTMYRREAQVEATTQPSPEPLLEPQFEPEPQPAMELPGLAPESDTLFKILEDIGDCKRCRLHTGRNKIVFGAGDEHAKLVFVGEGPGADEDAQGFPFVGRAGQLLTQMIENTASKEGIPILRKDVYICNVVKCRPPENRTPEPDEMEICGQFLFRQLSAIRPKAICALGGTASRAVQEKEIVIRKAGVVSWRGLRTVVNEQGQTVVLNRNGLVVLLNNRQRDLDSFEVPLGATMLVPEGTEIDAAAAKKGVRVCEWDPHNVPVLADVDGVVGFEDIVEGETMRWELEPGSKKRRMAVMEHKGALHPQIVIKAEDGTKIQQYHVPERSNIEVREGQMIRAGTVLAKRAREVVGTQDITGGLPRVTEIFEARTPKDPAVIAEIDGTVELGERKKGKRSIIVKGEDGTERAHLVPHGKYLRVHKGDRVHAGDALCEGPMVPHDILRISGLDEVYNYLLNEVQTVYRSQGVTIDDKHIEIIISQMLRKVRVVDAGDSDFLPGIVVDRHRFRAEHTRVARAEGKPPTFEQLLLGITKAALQSESFISAASFQETTKVLTEAAIGGKVDTLVGLKENVILGHLIPAGTGFQDYHRTLILHRFEEAEMEALGQETAAG